MPNASKESEHTYSSTSSLHFIMFGYDTFSAAKNMAIDEVIKERSEEEGRIFIRFFSFTNPSMILALSDSPKCLRWENLEGVEISRRKSGGKPIYADQNVLAYTISGTTETEETRDFTSVESVHKYFGPRIASAIEKYSGTTESVTIGNVFSVDVNGKPIAGHAQYPTAGRSFFYHGVTPMKKWDADKINRLLRMRPGDYEKLQSLPSIDSISTPAGGNVSENIEDAKVKLSIRILEEVSGGDYEQISSEERKQILSKADALVESNYKTSEWIKEGNGGKLNENSTFCFLYEG